MPVKKEIKRGTNVWVIEGEYPEENKIKKRKLVSEEVIIDLPVKRN
jgi:hypothetical protein